MQKEIRWRWGCAAIARQTKLSKRVNSIYEKSVGRGWQNTEQLQRKLRIRNVGPMQSYPSSKTRRWGLGLRWVWAPVPTRIEIQSDMHSLTEEQTVIFGTWTSFGDGIYIRVIKFCFCSYRRYDTYILLCYRIKNSHFILINVARIPIRINQLLLIYKKKYKYPFQYSIFKALKSRTQKRNSIPVVFC